LIFDLNKTFTKSYLLLCFSREVTEVFYLRQNFSTDGSDPLILDFLITDY